MELSSLSFLVLAGSVCNNIRICCSLLAVATFVIGGIFLLNLFSNNYTIDHEKILRRGGIVLWILTFVFAIVGSFMPSEKSVYMFFQSENSSVAGVASVVNSVAEETSAVAKRNG